MGKYGSYTTSSFQIRLGRFDNEDKKYVKLKRPILLFITIP